MTDALAHRGPDGRGTVIEGAIGLGHRRLAILDPSERGAQPMQSASGRFLITYSGEVYNFQDLRRELEGRGRRFRTGTDTEVIIEAWEEWGTGAVERLNGMFAFGVWDTRERALYLVRDRFGIKPLYICDDGVSIRFASEIKAILADASVPRSVDWNGLRSVLELGYSAGPFTCFNGIRQLAPATVLRATAQSVTETPARLLEAVERTRIDHHEALDRFDDSLDRAIALQMVSDVPIGAFLSGGLDSTRIVEGMTRVSGPKPRAFSVGFTSTAFDESTSAAEAGRRLGIAHQVDVVDIDLADTAIRVGESFDDPFADSSALAVYHLCRSASQYVKVALSGDGADELLAGYVTHRIAPFAPAIRAIPGPVRNALLRSASTLLPVGDHPYSARELVRRLLLAGGEPEGRSHASWRRYFSPGDERLLLSEDALQSVAAAVDPIDIYARAYREAAATGSRLRAAMSADLAFYLPNDMLTKIDRMSMAHSLEVRVPMLEDNFVNLVRSFPDHLLYTFRGKGKRILRDSIRKRMPWFDLTRPKRGFLVPVAQGFRADLAQLLRDLLASRAAHDSDIFNRGEVEKLLQRHEQGVVDASFQLYTCLMVLLWWRKSFG